MAFGEAAGEQPAHFRVERHGGQVDDLERQRGRERARDLAFGRVAELDDESAEPDPAPLTLGRALRLEGRVELLGRDRAVLDQDLTETSAGGLRRAESAHVSLLGQK